MKALKIILIFSVILQAASTPVNASKKKSEKSSVKLPENYQELTGCEKQSILWEEINKTEHKKLPKYKKLGVFQLLSMSLQNMQTKIEYQSDIAPKKWKKYLHRRGATALAKIVPRNNSKFTGVFQGAECALIRLSLTYKPGGKKGFAPGIALKVFRDRTPSANISALYHLDGQGQNYNFFDNALSNIVPIGNSVGQKLVHAIFKRVTDYPEQLSVQDMSAINSKGDKVLNTISPKQVFFVPSTKLKSMFSDKKHEVREDFFQIPTGFSLYKIYAVSEEHKEFDYFSYSLEKRSEFLKSAELIGEIVTQSRFIASEFGDTRIFFQHQTQD